MFPMLIGAGAELLGGAVAAQSTARENRRMRDWQTHMSNTAYQRSVADMRAAGLNPLMMMGGAGGAASTPSPQLAGVPGEALAQGISRASNSAKMWMRAKDEMRLLNEQVLNAQHEGRVLQAQKRKLDTEGDIAAEDYKRLIWDSVTMMEPRALAELENTRANTANSLANAGLSGAKRNWLAPQAISQIIRDVMIGLLPFGSGIKRILGPGRKVVQRLPRSTTRTIPR